MNIADWLGSDRAVLNATLTELHTKNLGYLYLSAFLFAILVGWLNFYPMAHKQKLKLKGNIRANMQIFKVLKSEQSGESTPLVVLEEDGVVGEYNRANRSLFHFLENMPSFLVCLFPASYVFPVPTFFWTVIFVIGRLWHQTGYVKGYGS